MLRVIWRLSGGYRLAPWRSPYLRWRMETYWGLHADRIGCHDFWRFGWQRRAELWRYLQWAARQARSGERARRPARKTASAPDYNDA